MRQPMAVTLVILLASVSLASAQSGTPRARSGRGPMGQGMMGGHFERDLFPPDIVLSNQIALGLSADQVTTIKKQVGDTHTRVLDIQVDLQRITEQLSGALAGPKVDEAPALSLASQAMDLEKQVKSQHLALMIRIKNLLTPEQQDKARAMSTKRQREIVERVRTPKPAEN